jgi:mono/diheme cytochrome c family protein
VDAKKGLRPTKPWKIAGVAAIMALGIAGAGALFVYFGAYDVAADVPHTRLVYWLLDTARDRSVAVRAEDVHVPPSLGEPLRISAGAGLYNEMCSSCHLAPGMAKTEISQGLYPAAPELSRGPDLTPGEEFWIIKHGIKMSGMAAWGKTHNDTLIWDMVAFLRKLPGLSPAQYLALVKSAPEDHDQMMKMMNMEGMDQEDHK